MSSVARVINRIRMAGRRVGACMAILLAAEPLFAVGSVPIAAQNVTVRQNAYVARFISGKPESLDGAPLVLRQPITLKLNNVTVERALREVMAHAALSISYSKSVVPVARLVSVDVADASVI